MSLILGKNVILYIITSASPEVIELIGCARNVKITMNAESADKTTVGSGTTREFKPLSTSWNATIDGLSVTNNITVRDLLGYIQGLTLLAIEVDLGDGGAPLTGDAFLTNVEPAGNYNDAATYNVYFQGTGILNIP